MGKADEQPLPSSVVSQDSGQNVEARCGCGCASIRKFIGLRCIFVLLLSAAVLLSAIFWLPPFLRFADQKDLHPDARYKGHDIVASFIVKKPVSLLQDNILQLEDDIFEEIPFPSTKVMILSLDPLSWSNMTKVVFAVDPDGKYSEISSAAVGLTRSSFKDFVTGQSILHLTSSFGDTYSFEVLRFRGGITIVPPQKAFLLQKAQAQFNFTLNSSIYQIRMNFHELASQLKSGLHLASYENLYVILSNTEGSTVAPPTIVQASIVLEVGNNRSGERLKELAQTIANSHSKNLGLNHTEFGRVKQVRLSSILQHSLHGSDGSGTVWSPSPAPLPHPHHHHHHHHHGHHHHHHHHNAHLAPAVLPAYTPAPAPANGRGVTPPEIGSPAAAKSVTPPRSSQAESPNCRSGYRKRPTRKAAKHTHLVPAVAPIAAPHSFAASPKQQVEPPAHVSHSVPASSPLPNVAFAHAEPLPKKEPAAEHSNTHFHGPSTSSSSAGHPWTAKWASLSFLVLVLHM